ncbi:MAG: nucleotidyltransferase family protein [Lachnospiraceae bacterium]|nr:nucleotidyltransferase family protein [Lachnospiraceae bacterium]
MPGRIGIIAEYNPFHEGHAYHISEVRRRFPDSDIVVYMSGDFVQRGEPAIASKYYRAKRAIMGGADIVLSPPVFASVSSAGEFARYGITGLLGAGCEAVSFGCEDTDICEHVGEIKLITEYERSSEYNDRIRTCMSFGKTFPAAREEALKQAGILPDSFLEKIKKPNNLLAFEYIRALCEKDREKNIGLIPVERKGMGYHEDRFTPDAMVGKSDGSEFPSAEFIRNRIKALEYREEDGRAKDVPAELADYLTKHRQVFADDLSDMLYYRIAASDPCELSNIRDCDTETANRIKNLRTQYEDFSQFAELVKTKDVTYTRISRCFINILLDIRDNPAELPYMYALACDKEKRYILSDISDNEEVKILLTGKDEAALMEKGSVDVAASLKTDRLAQELYTRLAYRKGCDRLPGRFRDYIFV